MRQELLLHTGWLFHRGDVADPIPNEHLAVYMSTKAGYARGPAKRGFDDSDWRPVDLPHDWSVEGPFDEGNYLSQGFLPRGVAWYRRHFALEDTDRGRRIALRFEGVATHCTVYVNGHLLARNFCGYTPFVVEISDVARFGEDLNVVAVRVDATAMEGWWYEGAGIYRDVWLVKTHAVHVADDGVFVRPERLSPTEWDTHVQTTLVNASDAAATVRVVSRIENLPAATSDATLPPRSTREVFQRIPVVNPKLWSLEQRNLYSLQTRVELDGRAIDERSTPFGYRTIRFDADEGFFLNDRHVLLKGVCNHQDHAGVGVAVPDSIHEFRVRRMLQMGANAWRCAHNPPSRALLDACDRLGMLIIDETRNFGAGDPELEQLRTMVRRDRNHPCIILWSICNEEAVQGTPVGGNIARKLAHAVRELDPSRPVTAAISGGIMEEAGIAGAVDVIGINYQLHLYDTYRAAHPKMPIVASETHCNFCTRGVYATDPQRRVFGSYDRDAAAWGATARATWRAVSSRPYIAGLFAWTGFDYRGEPQPHGWPCISSHWGIVDTCGFPKDVFYLHKAFFTAEPFVHLLPHWNDWQRGQPVRVMAISNCDEVELSLNGRPLERKAIDPIDMAEWTVPYEPGELRAGAYRDGQPVARCIVATTGPAVALGLEIDAAAAGPIAADGRQAVPVTVFATDQQGRRVPTASHFVTFAVAGPGKILGVGNGDPSCHEPDKASARSLYNGLAQVIVQTTTAPGAITLAASSPGLKPAELVLPSTQARSIPSAPPAAPRVLLRDWRMSPILAKRPDPNQNFDQQDVNNWQPVDPSQGPQAAWPAGGGWALYRTTGTLRRDVRQRGGRIIFREIRGQAQVYVNGAAAAEKRCQAPGELIVLISAGCASVAITVLVHASSAPAGLCGPVEVLAGMGA